MLQPLRELFQPADYPDLLVGLERADDAAVYQLDAQRAIVSTVDFFPPIVDNPHDFGAIAAANALSDIYAMGGRPLFAVNLVAFPDDLDKSILQAILRGGAETIRAAGAVIAGGHTVVDQEPKYGLAVTGIIDPAHVRRKGGAQPGDVLLLTKPLGAGVVTTAHKQGACSASELAAAVASMKLLNRLAADAADAAAAHAMTDITGFGLLGHAQEMARAGAVDFHFALAALPWLPGARRHAVAGRFPGGMRRNRDYFAPHVTFDPATDAIWQRMLWTPETSGGLLVAVAPDRLAAFQTLCPAPVVGRVSAGSGRIHVSEQAWPIDHSKGV